MLRLLLFDSLLFFNGARVLSLHYILDFIVAKPVDVHPVVLVEVGTSDVAVERYCVEVLVVSGLNDIESVRDNVGVGLSPIYRFDLLYSNISA